ncbi:MAG: hypothetical protein JST84_04850 [Acidobacteria bacterium]|nr:hypothetical protein [Acidobacteriota bacterium]
MALKRLLPVIQSTKTPVNATKPSKMVGGDKFEDKRKPVDTLTLGLYRDVIRQKDGSFIGGFEVEMSPTAFSDHTVIEGRYETLGRLLALKKPANTIIQFRFAVTTDDGDVIESHLADISPQGDLYAQLLHEKSVLHYQFLALTGLYRRTKLYCFVYIPTSEKPTNQFFPTLTAEVKQNGIKGVGQALQAAFSADNEAILRRDERNESEAYDKARKTFRIFEREQSVKFRRLNQEELFAALVNNHRQTNNSLPQLPSEGTDIRGFLGREEIKSLGNILLHGNVPVAIVSLFTPPNPYIYADLMRVLTINGQLNFRHTIISESIFLDQEKAAKSMRTRARQIRRSSSSAKGGQRDDPESSMSYADVMQVRANLVGGNESLIKARFYVVIYGNPVNTKEELTAGRRSLDELCENVIDQIRKMPSADADREEAEALLYLYKRSLIGELSPSDTGREFSEVSRSIAPFIPTETEWSGSKRTHTLVSIPTGKVIGLNLFDRSLIPSPVGTIICAPRGGKSVFLGRFITDILACMKSRVKAVDFGESFGALSEVLGGRQIRFDVGAEKALNVWDYPGLDDGIQPDSVQIGFVVGDLMQLARLPETDVIAENILSTIVAEVYKNEVPRNLMGGVKTEPTTVNAYEMLRHFPFESEAAKNKAEEIRLGLDWCIGNNLLDAPTHQSFKTECLLDVYELDSLDKFPERVRDVLAYRAASKVMQAIGRVEADGTKLPLLIVFDEMWKIRDKYPRILSVLKKAARQGGKENAFTMLASQAYEDFALIPDLAKTAGLKILGKQIGDYTNMVADSGLSVAAAAGISVIKNVPGQHAQFLACIGSGEDKFVEMIQVDLSPAELWTYTTNPDERNARARVKALHPDWSTAEIVTWLATQYPQGLALRGEAFDESLLTGETQ